MQEFQYRKARLKGYVAQTGPLQIVLRSAEVRTGCRVTPVPAAMFSERRGPGRSPDRFRTRRRGLPHRSLSSTPRSVRPTERRRTVPRSWTAPGGTPSFGSSEVRPSFCGRSVDSGSRQRLRPSRNSTIGSSTRIFPKDRLKGPCGAFAPLRAGCDASFRRRSNG